MKVKTNEIQAVYKIMENRGISKRKVAIRMGISPSNLQQRLNRFDNDKLRMSVLSLEKILKALDYQIILVPNWLAREVMKENPEAMPIVEIEEEEEK